MVQSTNRMKKKIYSKAHLASKMLLRLISFLQLKARTHVVEVVPMDRQMDSFLIGFPCSSLYRLECYFHLVLH